MIIGRLALNGTEYKATPVSLTNYHSVQSLNFEEYHTRLLIAGPKGRPFWSPCCKVILQSDGLAICQAMEFEAVTFLQVMNVTVADYEKRQMAKALDFMPFEISRGQKYTLQYSFKVK